MIKQPLKLLLGLLFLFLIGITFGSCEAEKEFGSKDKTMVIKRCSMREATLQANPKLMRVANQLKSLNIKSNRNITGVVNARIVFDEKTGLYYDDEKGIYVEKDGRESYNFPIIQTDVTEKIKNITFNKNASNGFDVYIVKYDYTIEDTYNYSKEDLSQRNIVYYPIVKDGITYTEYFRWLICVDIKIKVVVPIDHGDLTGNFGTEEVWVTISSHCESGGNVGPPITGGGGTSGGTSGGDSSSGGGSSAGSSADSGISGTGPGTTGAPIVGNNSIISAAAVDSNIINDPCKDLINNTASGAFKQKLYSLNSPLNFNKNHETAYIDTKNGNIRGYAYVESPSGQNNSIDINSIPFSVSYMHVHTNDYEIYDENGEPKLVRCSKIPSGEDLISFLGPMQYRALYQHIPATQTYGLTISSAAFYAFKLKVNDYTSMTNAINDLRNNFGFDPNKLKEDIDLKQKRILALNLSPQEEKKEMEKMFLGKLKESKLDQIVGLFEGSSQGNDLSSTFYSWKEKTLNENNEIIDQPCNN